MAESSRAPPFLSVLLSLRQNLEHLTQRAPRFLRRASPALPARVLALGKCDAAVTLADHFERRRAVRPPEIKSGLRRDVGMTPSVEDDAGETAAAAHSSMAIARSA